MIRTVKYAHPFGVIVFNIELTDISEADALIIRDVLGKIRMQLNLLSLDFDERNLEVSDVGAKAPSRQRKGI